MHGLVTTPGTPTRPMPDRHQTELKLYITRMVEVDRLLFGLEWVWVVTGCYEFNTPLIITSQYFMIRDSILMLIIMCRKVLMVCNRCLKASWYMVMKELQLITHVQKWKGSRFILQRSSQLLTSFDITTDITQALYEFLICL